MSVLRWKAYLWSVAMLPGAAAFATPPAGHGAHPPIPGRQFFLQCRINTNTDPIVVREQVRIDAADAPATLDQVVAMPAPLAPIRIKEYIPRAVLDQSAAPSADGSGPCAIELSIDGVKQSMQRWLVAGDPARDRLVSYIGTWRYQTLESNAQRNDLFKLFRDELTRDPTLIINAPKQANPVTIPATPGTVSRLADTPYTVRVKEFHPHFAIDNRTKEPTNQSDKRVNPAALVVIERGEQREERWVFAKFPDYGANGDASLPLRVTLDCPQDKESQTPDFVVVTVARESHEVWTRADGAVTSVPLSPERRVEIAGSNYTFHLKRFLPSATLVEKYVPNKESGSVPALRVETTAPGGKSKDVWLALEKQRTIPTPIGKMAVVFTAAPAEGGGGHGWDQ